MRLAHQSQNRKTIEVKPKPVEKKSLFGAGIFDDETETEPQDDSFIRVYKILNRDFVGFSKESQFTSCFQMNERWERILQPVEIKRILEIEDKQQRIWELVNLFDDQIKSLKETKPSPRIVVLALTPQMVEEAHAVQVTGNFFLNLRRAIKARAMKWGIPIQLIQRNTILGKKGRFQKGPIQEKSNPCLELLHGDVLQGRGCSLASYDFRPGHLLHRNWLLRRS